MLNIDEYNESLYRSIDKRNKKKAIIQDYSEYLAHAKNYKYVYKEGDRYFYPEDIKRMKERKANLLTKKEIENSANTNSKIRALKNEQSKTVEALMNARSNAEIDDIVNKNRQKVAATKLMNETVAQERANKQAKVEAARADQNARAYDNNKAAADAQKRALQSTGPVAQQKIEAAKSNNYQNNRKAEEAQKIANQQNSTIGKQKAEEQKKQQYQNNVNASYHYEQDKADRDRLNNVTNPDDKWLNKQVENGNYSALQKRNDLILDRQNATAAKIKQEQAETANKINEAKKEYDEAVERMSKERAEGLKKYEENLENYKKVKAKKKATAKVLNNALKSMFHSSFSISDDEMKNYLIHGSIKPEK